MTTDLRLRGVSLASVAWYAAVALGWPLIAYSAWHVCSSAGLELVPSFLMVAALIAGLELLPLVQGRGHDPQGVVMSTSFTFAMLFIWGLWPTVLLIATGAVLADLRAGKVWWKTIFNPAQYALSFAAAYLVVVAAREHPTLAAPLHTFHPGDLAWMAGAWVVYFAVNLALVSAVLTYDTPFRTVAFGDFRHEAMMTFSVLALSPLIVILAQGPWPLIPVLAVPLLMIYFTAQIALDREHQAGHDALTGLPNRATLTYDLDQALASLRRGGPPFALMLIDLDDFKAVNDALGHQAGDELLIEFAARMRKGLRPSDVVARLGGDEFAVVLSDVDTYEACLAAQRMRDAVVADAIVLEGVSVDVRFSAGIATCPGHGADPTTLLRHADIAMYRAKQTRSGVELYSADQDANAATRLGITGELRQAIEAGELELHYQPKVGLHRELVGVEALIRWHHPIRGWVSPDEFIPLAERSGVMPLLTQHVVRLALRQMARWRAAGLETPVAINISPTDLVGTHLVEVVTEQLIECSVAPTSVYLEITERVLTDQLEESRQTLDRLRAMGIGISLDDFGTGYSSLMRLSDLPVDEIKIDRAFVARLEKDPRAVGILRTLIGLAHALGVPAIAEGVETESQHTLLEGLRCDAVQGWQIARPMPGNAVVGWARAQRVAALEHGRYPRPAAVPELPAPLRMVTVSDSLPRIS
ncbi:diguanylate cyclase (GGDEF) domain-containing protein [Jatrophihabitans endophyticus]|uniref:Diguanylate cyclase (GGDEF) domain-containing protein n=1 Tax=Jatrophihabitans endophyticus TaxID=1206085 RepID=A0A1M5UG02_9ACTN|nr:EAL domain-containing protein [Jatrophihabitans endophyticus]SHH61909.1 diguanylate cyclase (GGDEF) domain-containing protein [Jatrophihabitans endophyticus]